MHQPVALIARTVPLFSVVIAVENGGWEGGTEERVTAAALVVVD